MLTQKSAHRKDTTAPLQVEMQHRHFAFIAATIKSYKPLNLDEDDAKRQFTKLFADACARSNPRFDRRRFMLACGEEG